MSSKLSANKHFHTRKFCHNEWVFEIKTTKFYPNQICWCYSPQSWLLRSKKSMH